MLSVRKLKLGGVIGPSNRTMIPNILPIPPRLWQHANQEYF